jgi:DNA-binding protein YbaB
MKNTELAPTADDAWADYQRLRDDLVTLRRSFREVSETAYSPDGLVSATVGSRGELTELTLDPRIYRTVDAAALAETITATIRGAVTAAAVSMVELTKPFLPDAPHRAGSGPGDADLDLDAVLRRVDGQVTQGGF